MAEKTCRELCQRCGGNYVPLSGNFPICFACGPAMLQEWKTAEQEREELREKLLAATVLNDQLGTENVLLDEEVERLRKAADRAFRIVDHIVHGNGDELRRKGNS